MVLPIGREVTNDLLSEHLSASGVEGLIAVVACDKPPVGTLAQDRAQTCYFDV